MLSDILPVDEIHDHFADDVLLCGFAFGNQERKGNERIVGQTLAAIGTIQDAVLVQDGTAYPAWN